MDSNKLFTSGKPEDHFEQKVQENVHIVFWLLKDFAWIMHFRAFGLLMAVPTFVLSVYITLKSLSGCFDMYYKWLFLQIRHNVNSPDESVDLDLVGWRKLRFNDIFHSDFARAMTEDSKWAIVGFLLRGELNIGNSAGLDYRELIKCTSDFYHNLAITCWILGNAVWMVGEFYFEDTTRYLAIPFFIFGLFFIVWYYLFVAENIEKQKASE